jgi:hypothetical protein
LILLRVLGVSAVKIPAAARSAGASVPKMGVSASDGAWKMTMETKGD